LGKLKDIDDYARTKLYSYIDNEVNRKPSDYLLRSLFFTHLTQENGDYTGAHYIFASVNNVKGVLRVRLSPSYELNADDMIWHALSWFYYHQTKNKKLCVFCDVRGIRKTLCFVQEFNKLWLNPLGRAMLDEEKLAKLDEVVCDA